MAGWRVRLQAHWYRAGFSPLLLPLLPVAWCFAALATIRRLGFRLGLLRSHALSRPVVVVGNISVGGTGKTPLVVWLARRLRDAGRHPGIISRGFGGAGSVVRVTPESDPHAVGDEPVLLARHAGVPVFVGRDRVAAGGALIAACPEVDVIICDDGLQHYRLQRDVEIVVADGRGFGNGHRLPAGPLREPLARLREVDALVCNGAPAIDAPSGLPRFSMELTGRELVSLADPARRCAPDVLRGQRLCAVAGIGDPERFFATLQGAGLVFEARAFVDHHVYRAEDFAFVGDRVLLMTEKDAVKCAGLFAGEAWVLPVAATVAPDLASFVLEKLDGRQTA